MSAPVEAMLERLWFRSEQLGDWYGAQDVMVKFAFWVFAISTPLFLLFLSAAISLWINY